MFKKIIMVLVLMHQTTVFAGCGCCSRRGIEMINQPNGRVKTVLTTSINRVRELPEEASLKSLNGSDMPPAYQAGLQQFLNQYETELKSNRKLRENMFLFYAKRRGALQLKYRLRSPWDLILKGIQEDFLGLVGQEVLFSETEKEMVAASLEPLISTSAQEIEKWLEGNEKKSGVLEKDEVVFYAIFKYFDALINAVA